MRLFSEIYKGFKIQVDIEGKYNIKIRVNFFWWRPLKNIKGVEDRFNSLEAAKNYIDSFYE